MKQLTILETNLVGRVTIKEGKMKRAIKFGLIGLAITLVLALSFSPIGALAIGEEDTENLLYSPGTGMVAAWTGLIKLNDGSLLCSTVQNAVPDIKIHKSTDVGDSWTHISTITPEAGHGLTKLSFLEWSDGDIWAFWGEGTAGDQDGYYAVSTDGGNTWGVKNLINFGDDLLYIWGKPLLMSNGDVGLPLSWYQDDNHQKTSFAKRNAATGVWTVYPVVADSTILCNEWNFFETASSQLVGLIRRDKYASVYRVYSDDLGETWSTPVAVYTTQNTGYWQTCPDVVKVDNQVYMALWYRRFEVGEEDINCRMVMSTDNGLTWENDYVVLCDEKLVWGGHGGGSAIIYLGDNQFMSTFHINYGSTGNAYWSRVSGSVSVEPEVIDITEIETDLNLLSDFEIGCFISYWYQKMISTDDIILSIMYAERIQVYQNELILRKITQ